MVRHFNGADWRSLAPGIWRLVEQDGLHCGRGYLLLPGVGG